MRIVLVNLSSEFETIEVDKDTDFSTFEMIAGSYVNIDPCELVIHKEGKVINGPISTTIFNLGLRDGDVLVASKKSNQPVRPNSASTSNKIDFSNINVASLSRKRTTANRSPTNLHSEQVRQQFLNLNPEMLNQIRTYNPTLITHLNDPVKFQKVFEEQMTMRESQSKELQELQNADIYDPRVQSRIEELIKKSNIDAQMEHAMEHNPESFAQTTMLYISCKVNKHDSKAFIDSGAQMTFVSLAFAKRCHIDNLIDTRWKGMARGVGTQNIVGRVHCVQLEISGMFLQMSVSVLEDQEMDMLIGLDMLKRYQCIINLKRNVLEIGSVGVETPFLPESELPIHARLNEQSIVNCVVNDTSDNGS